MDEYWRWLEGSFVGNLRAQSWYNGENPLNLNGYLNDRSNRLIGWVSMRQLRVKVKTCSDQRLISRCENDYNFFNEEKQSYSPGWTNETDSNEYNSAIIKSFQYQSSENLDTYVYFGEHGTYSGNGYVYEFRGSLANMKSNLTELHRLGWIDQKTRAVIIQMTLYNPNVGLFTSLTVLAEFLATGGVFTSIRIEPLNFYGKIQKLLPEYFRENLHGFSLHFDRSIGVYGHLHVFDYLHDVPRNASVYSIEKEIFS